MYNEVYYYVCIFLKGVPSDSIKEAVSSIISELQLETRKDYKANELSGGYKRKLWLGKLVLLLFISSLLSLSLSLSLFLSHSLMSVLL